MDTWVFSHLLASVNNAPRDTGVSTFICNYNFFSVQARVGDNLGSVPEAKRWEKTQVSMNRGTNQQEVECPYIQCPAVQGSKIPTRATTRMTLEDGMLGETSQAQKDECRVTPLPGSTWNSQIRGWKAGPW